MVQYGKLLLQINEMYDNGRHKIYTIMPGIYIGNRIGIKGSGVVILSPDGTPSGLTLTVISDTEIQLDWTRGSTNNDGTSIERSPDNATWAEIATVLGATVHYHNTGLIEDTLYYYRVREYLGVLYSSYSNIVVLRTWVAEYKTINDALTTPPDKSISYHQSSFLKTLLDGAVWSDLDSFRMLSQTINSASEALIDWKDVTKIGVLHGTTNPVFTANVGFLMNTAAARYIELLWNPSDGINYTLNDASIILFIRKDATEQTYDVGCYDGTYWSQVFYNSTAPAVQCVVNGGVITRTIATYVGLLIAQRISATQKEIYFAGSQIGATETSNAVAARSTNSMWLGCRHDAPSTVTSPSSRQYSLIAFGKSLTSGKITILTNAYNLYLGRLAFKMVDYSASALTVMRAIIIGRIWTSGYPTTGVDHITTGVAEVLASSAAQLASIDELTLHITGISDRTAYVWHPNSPNGKLFIWSLGHYYGVALKWETLGEGNLIRAAINAGYTVCGMWLPPANDGTEGQVHSYPVVSAPYQTIADLHLFYDQAIRIINELEDDYTDIYVGGHSGGAAMFSMVTALDERITKAAFSVSPFPRVLFDAVGVAYDWEQENPGLTDLIEIGDILTMSTSSGRKVFQSLITTESIFNLINYNHVPYALEMANRTANFTLEWDATTSTHEVSAAVSTKIINFLNS